MVGKLLMPFAIAVVLIGSLARAALSDGSDGALFVSGASTLALSADGRFDFTPITVDAAAVLTFSGGATLIELFATGDVFVRGVIDSGNRALSISAANITIEGEIVTGALALAAGNPSNPGGALGFGPAGTLSVGGRSIDVTSLPQTGVVEIASTAPIINVGTITLLPAVPEPSTALLLAAGLIALVTQTQHRLRRAPPR